MSKLYLLTYKHENGNVISQFLVTARTREGAMERVEQKYNQEYYSMTCKLVCQTNDDFLEQVT